MAIDPASISTLSFDCYGTLIDWERGILATLRPWAQRRALHVSDDELLAAFAACEPAAEEADPGALYSDILKEVMERIAHSLGAPCDDDDRRALAQSVGRWPAFDDTAAALARLKRHCRLVILSNVDHRSLSGTLPRLGVEIDAIVTAEDVGAYKPDRRMFDALGDAIEGLGADAASHLHVAQSLYHDIAPARALGFQTCWVDRRAGRDGGATPPAPKGAKPHLTVTSLEALAGRFDHSKE